MDPSSRVLAYKCPCCNAGLSFSGKEQQLTCEYCDNTFELDTIKAYNKIQQSVSADAFEWEQSQTAQWEEAEQNHLQAFQCPSCGGEIVTDGNAAATFCPFCDNPTILPARLEGGLKPDFVIPFSTSKEDAQTAFLKLCKGKPLLPKMFTSEQRIERITGVYVPFWLYDCQAEYDANFKATRTRHWSDNRYHYTKTDHFLLTRTAEASFAGIPMDGSSKMDDVFMESIEPYDYSKLETFHTAYLTGYLADKYDIPSENGADRIRDRVDQTMQDELQNTILGYTTAIPTNRQLKVNHSKARYVLLPVWLLNTNYEGKLYTFAMNGQTGKMTGSFPVCKKRMIGWFTGICAGVTVLATLLQMLL